MVKRNPANYRPNVCAAILNRSGDKLLFCHRSGFRSDEGWQFPQGGYNPALDLVSEMKRELREEIDTDSVAVLKICSKEYFYDFPAHTFLQRGGFRGQRQRWVLCQFLGDDSDINVITEDPEFDEWRWATPKECAKEVVDFKRHIYAKALKELKLL